MRRGQNINTIAKHYTNAVEVFFDKAAIGCQENSESWPWSLLRNNQKAAIQHHLGNLKDKTVIDFGAGVDNH